MIVNSAPRNIFNNYVKIVLTDSYEALEQVNLKFYIIENEQRIKLYLDKRKNISIFNDSFLLDLLKIDYDNASIMITKIPNK